MRVSIDAGPVRAVVAMSRKDYTFDVANDMCDARRAFTEP
jgi:hypothetical protein